MGTWCEDTLFSRLVSGQVQCQRTFCTPSWYMEAQCKHSLEMRAPIHIQRANCYSIALARQRLTLYSLSAAKAFTQKIWGTNLFLVWQHEV